MKDVTIAKKQDFSARFQYWHLVDMPPKFSLLSSKPVSYPCWLQHAPQTIGPSKLAPMTGIGEAGKPTIRGINLALWLALLAGLVLMGMLSVPLYRIIKDWLAARGEE
jgi:hypothetical protein